MKTVTLSNDQAISIRIALTARIEYLERLLADSTQDGHFSNEDLMFIRDELDVARQSFHAVESCDLLNASAVVQTSAQPGGPE